MSFDFLSPNSLLLFPFCGPQMVALHILPGFSSYFVGEIEWSYLTLLDPEVPNLFLCKRKAKAFLEIQDHKQNLFSRDYVPCPWPPQAGRWLAREKLGLDQPTAVSVHTRMPGPSAWAPRYQKLSFWLIICLYFLSSPCRKQRVQVRSLICICYFQWQALSGLYLRWLGCF